MRAWVVAKPGPVSSGPLELTDRPVPEPGPGELLIKVIACGVCRTDLHLAEGDLPPHHPRMTPGHEVVGQVAATGPGTTRFRAGDRVGAASVQDSLDPPPVPLDSAILFAPVGTIVPAALAALDRNGTLAVAGIYLTDIPSLNYEKHLFQERNLRSVTSNTRGDAQEFLTLAERLKIKVTTTPYPFDQADQALADLEAEHVHGAAVLQM
jgi:alcohol dehydrogenase, propanol-preferring